MCVFSLDTVIYVSKYMCMCVLERESMYPNMLPKAEPVISIYCKSWTLLQHILLEKEECCVLIQTNVDLFQNKMCYQ